MYLQYVRSLKDQNEEERRDIINDEFRKVYGVDCFDIIDELNDQICFDLTTYEQAFMDL